MSLTLNGSSPAVTFPDGTTQSTAANITAPYTANGVVYASSTSALATGSNLSFDGNYTLALTNGTSGLLNLGPTAGQARIYSDSTGAFFGSSSSTPMIFRTNNTEYMRLTTSGYLGIGTSSPSYQLDVTGVSRVLSNNQSDGIIINGNDNSNVKLRLTNSGTGGESYNIQVGVTSASNSNLVVRCNTSSSDLLQLSQSGNLGLGAGPATWYSYSRAFQLGAGGFIQGRSNDATTLELGSNAYLNTSGNWTYPYTAASSKLDASNGTFRFNIAPSGTAGTTISYTQAMTLSNAGGLSVGTTADPGAGAIYATGNITAYYSSDIKFKTNVQDIQDPLGIVTAIGSKTFDWTDEYLKDHGGEDEYFQPKQSFGVIAQDVQKVFPQAVRTRTDGSLAVDYEKLAILSFGAIGQLLKRVEALESK